MPTFTIRKMTALRQPIMLKDQAIIAHMAVDYGAIRLSAVNLHLTAQREFKVVIPCYGRTRVSLIDRNERELLLKSALAAYSALTGCDTSRVVAAAKPEDTS